MKGWDSTASVAQEVKVRTEQDFALAQRTTLLDARVGGTESKISIVETAQATDREATAQQITNLTATVTTNQSTVQAAIQSEATARATAYGALTTRVDGIQSTANGASAQAQTASTAVSGLNGKVSALTTIKTSTTVGGRTVMAGLALGVEGQQQESQILAYAQRFAILDESSGTLIVPFVVQGGKVIIDSAIIGNASIGVAQLTQSLQSSDYLAGQRGLKINFATGEFEYNSALGGGGRQTVNSAGGKVFDEKGQIRYQWGNLSV
ncbi:hypothetical protein ALO87_200114 [Pseudomonas syringae pv. apii]|nr:hypothetical protein ALO87_200114 [Pseudomonas syringae pv. apii]